MKRTEVLVTLKQYGKSQMLAFYSKYGKTKEQIEADLKTVPLKELFPIIDPEFDLYLALVGPLKMDEVKILDNFEGIEKAVADQIRQEMSAREKHKDREPLPESVGVATMKQDGTIFMQLRSVESDGTIAEALKVVKTGDPDYDQVVIHLGGIQAGESKKIPPFGT